MLDVVLPCLCAQNYVTLAVTYRDNNPGAVLPPEPFWLLRGGRFFEDHDIVQNFLADYYVAFRMHRSEPTKTVRVGDDPSRNPKTMRMVQALLPTAALDEEVKVSNPIWLSWLGRLCTLSHAVDVSRKYGWPCTPITRCPM